MNYRLYAFAAHHYLSPLQCGLQTAHVVGEILSRDHALSSLNQAVRDWATKDKTIIICGAGNHKGVVDCYAELQRTGIDTGFVAGAIFFEDEQSMNSMATACGVIVPEKYWNTRWVTDEFAYGGGYWEFRSPDEQKDDDIGSTYGLDTPEGQFIQHIKSFRLV